MSPLHRPPHPSEATRSPHTRALPRPVGAPIRAMMPFVMIGAFCTSSGCGQDPILERAEQEAEQESADASRPAATEAAPPPDADASRADPLPNKSGVTPPPEGAPDPPAEGEQGTPGAVTVEGPTVILRGEVRYEAFEDGLLRIDVFDGDQTDFSQRPSVVAMEPLSAPGAFAIAVPQSAGKVWLSAFNDANGNNRPDPRDPTGFCDANPVELEDGDVEGLVIELSTRPPPDDGGS